MSLARPLAVLIGTSLLVLLAGCKSAQDRVLLGDDLFIQRQYARALEEYRRARRNDPGMPDIDRKIERTQIRLYLQQGDQCVARGRFDEARGAYAEVGRLDPGNRELEERWARLTEAEAEWHFDRGQERLAAGDPFSAIPEFERALEIAGTHARAAAALDRAVREQAERIARAEAAYDEGRRALELGLFEDAIEHFNLAIGLDPNHPGAALELTRAAAELVEQYLQRGDASAEQRSWAEALDLYEQARSHDPSSRRIRARIRQAQRELEAERWLERGDRARQQEDWSKAFACYEQARLLTSDPDWVQDRFDAARNALVAELAAEARAAEQDGRFDDALAGYRAILEIDPAHPDADGWYDGLTMRLQSAEAAYQDGQTALRAGNLLLARRHFRACTEALPGYLDAAERLAEVRPLLDLAKTLYDRARAAERTGSRERARLLYEECLATSRPFRDADERLEELFVAVGAGHDAYEPYLDACRAQARRDHQRARDLLIRCRDERPGHRDVAERLEQVNTILDRAAEAFRRAEAAARQNKLKKARNAYAECLMLCSPYRDTAARLAPIEASLRLFREAGRLERERQLTEARDRYRTLLGRHPAHPLAAERLQELDRQCAALEADYALLVETAGNDDHRTALSLAVKLRNRCRGYKDVEARIAQLEIEADYADALSFEEAGRWQLAARAYGRCVQRDPTFRDAGNRLHHCRAQVRQARVSGDHRTSGHEDDWEFDWDADGRRPSARGSESRQE